MKKVLGVNKYLLFAISFTIVFAVLYLNSPRIEKLPAEVSVKDDGVLGFAADPGIANFGSVPRGNVGERRIILRNEDNFPKTIKFMATGKIGRWISFQENNFVLAKNETRQVIVNVNVPNDAQYGIHKGEIVTLMRRALLKESKL